MATPVEIKPDNDRELLIARRIAAPAAALYRCWTDPALIPQWFCPKPWVAEVVKMDVRPGGASQMIFKGPNGESFPNDGVYLEVVPDRKLVFTDAYLPGWVPNPGAFFTGIITFDPLPDGGTRYIARALHWTKANCEKHAAMGFADGWAKAFDQLVETARTL